MENYAPGIPWARWLARKGHLLAKLLGGPGDMGGNLVAPSQKPVSHPIMSGVERTVGD